MIIPIIIVVTLLFTGFTYRTKWKRFARLLSIALVGQASMLQLIYSPPWGVYQHYYSWREFLNFPRVLFLLFLVGQTIIVLRAGRPILHWLRTNLPTFVTRTQGILFLAFFGFSGVLLSGNVGHYGMEILLTIWISFVSMLNLLLIATSLPSEFLKKVSGWLSSRFGSHLNAITRTERRLPWAVALWVTIVSAAISWIVFERVPHIPDSVSYLFQAKYFATGQLYLPAPPDSDSFALSHIVNDGQKWYGYGFPGWPAILSLGVLIGAPWLLNPLISGLTILVAFALLRRLFDRNLANFSILLLAVSPWFIFMSASFMAHSVSLLWVLLAMLAIEKARESRRGHWGVVAGLCLGALFLTRPLVGILVGVVLGLWALGLGGRRLAPLTLTGLILTGFLLTGLIFPYNRALTGKFFKTPQMKWTDENWYPGADRLGFGPDIGNVGWPHLDPLPGHGLPDVIINLNKNFYMTNFELFGWAFGSLGFVVILLLFRGAKRTDWLFLAIFISIIAGHSFYWNSGGPDLGARYWYQGLLPLTVLTIRGMQTLKNKLLETGLLDRAGSHLAVFVVAASLVAFANMIPWRSVVKYKGYRGMNAQVGRLAKKYNFGRSLVFIKQKDKEDFAAAFIYNSPTLDGEGPIYALDAGPANRKKVQQYFPDRPVWSVGRYPTIEDSMIVLSGPIYPKTKYETN